MQAYFGQFAEQVLKKFFREADIEVKDHRLYETTTGGPDTN